MVALGSPDTVSAMKPRKVAGGVGEDLRKKSDIQPVKYGPITIPVYYLTAKDTYESKWKEEGRERRIKNKDYNKLRDKVRDAAKRLAKSSPTIETLSAEEKLIIEEVRRRNITLADVATIHTSEPVTVTEAIAKFLKSKQDASTDHQLTLRTHLNQFAKTFGQRNINGITALELDEWLLDIAPGLRTRKNKRAVIVSLWRWARDKGMLPIQDRTAAERTSTVSKDALKRQTKRAETWSPEEIRSILKIVPQEYVPWVVLSGFAGVRSRELFPNNRTVGVQKEVLCWENIEWDCEDGPRIFVPREVAKAPVDRTIPLTPQLVKWLTPYRGKTGPICGIMEPWKAPRKTGANPEPKALTQIISEALGVPFKKNALRHSFGTYRVLETDHVGRVALQMGNSEARVKANYLNPSRTKAEAKAWFSVIPTTVRRKLEVVA